MRVKDLRKLEDSRQVKKPMTGYLRFSVERMTSGDFKGIAVKERTQLISSEWKALSAGEQQVCSGAIR